MPSQQLWYVKVHNQETGPLSPRQLKSLADSGQITTNTEVRLGTDGNWMKCCRVKGLFNEEPMPPSDASGEQGRTPHEQVISPDPLKIVEPSPPCALGKEPASENHKKVLDSVQDTNDSSKLKTYRSYRSSIRFLAILSIISGIFLVCIGLNELIDTASHSEISSLLGVGLGIAVIVLGVCVRQLYAWAVLVQGILYLCGLITNVVLFLASFGKPQMVLYAVGILISSHLSWMCFFLFEHRDLENDELLHFKNSRPFIFDHNRDSPLLWSIGISIVTFTLPLAFLGAAVAPNRLRGFLGLGGMGVFLGLCFGLIIGKYIQRHKRPEN
jgi:hypothetical protein